MISNSSPVASEAGALAMIRRMLRLLYMVGTLGLLTELLLLKHTEELLQFVPLVLLVVGALLLAWSAMGGGAASLRAFRVTMILFVIGATAGLFLHYRGNVDFLHEANSSLEGYAFFWKAIHGKTPPSLAPGAMLQLGLLGWIYTYRHPTLTRETR